MEIGIQIKEQIFYKFRNLYSKSVSAFKSSW